MLLLLLDLLWLNCCRAVCDSRKVKGVLMCLSVRVQAARLAARCSNGKAMIRVTLSGALPL